MADLEARGDKTAVYVCVGRQHDHNFTLSIPFLISVPDVNTCLSPLTTTNIMPRENSLSDSDGRSLTPDLEDEMAAAATAAPSSPQYPAAQSPTPAAVPNLTSASKRSLHSRPTRTSAVNGSTSSVHPKERFRLAAKKVIALHRGLGSTRMTGNQAGAEPGVDPRRSTADIEYGHIKQDCVIELMDYSGVRSSFGRMTNQEFIHLMNDPVASQRESWVKVRWINIGGLSWDVIKAVSLRYELHPLALEDIFHTRSQNRSKADYFSKHLFIRVLCHELGDVQNIPAHQTAAFGSTLTDAPRSSSPEAMDTIPEGKDERTSYSSSESTKKKGPLLPHSRRDIFAVKDENRTLMGTLLGVSDPTAALRKREEQEVTLDALKSGERVGVNVSPMFIFLMRDGTVISIHPTPNVEFTEPITRRLRQRDTMLRRSVDASLVVQALLDLIVDKALEVVDAYHTKINKFEKSILMKTKMKTVRSLHIISGDLTMHKRTLEPIKTLIYGLRRYDVDRCAALIDMSDANADVKVVGFMSHKSKIYLADVYDHVEYILSSMDMFASVAENLISYTFNIASYEMNEVMRRLTLITIIFLPLTLLTGYFGMNFEDFWSVQHGHSDALFWYIATPVMAVILPLFIWPDVQRMIHYISKKTATKKALEEYKRK
ncbi:hypothetical protein BDN72DRAFT_828680 [Pluteus cervinus]|uniref:Uncharacterized protein n=1 Tax=Pluteus cervinus TaxID=181527 RepID=A0ACD3A575_9AGAR|nr:hypothetical protein BDN72DRAFT_828680 [Pluteus cervinus]